MTLLNGVRILSLELFGAGPYGSQFLADLGAEVIKIENAATGGDPARHVGPHLLGEADSQYFQTWHSNKKSVSLDLKTAAGRRDFERLVKGADAVMNNLRGDQPAKLGIDYAGLKTVNPAIVCLHISAYGRDNARAAWPGYDFLMQAEAGLMDMTGEPEGPPARFGPSIIDYMTGTTGVAALLAGILRARTTGTGGDIDTCLFDVALHQLGYAALWHLNEGDRPTRQPRSAHLSVAPVQTFPTADGWIFVMCMTDKFWNALLDVLGRRDLGADPRFATAAARRGHRAALTSVLDAEFRKRSTAAWLAALSGVLPVAPVLDVAQALANPHVAAAGMVQTIRHPLRPELKVLASPVKVNGRRLPRAPGSVLGADNASLLGTGDAPPERRASKGAKTKRGAAP
jgi:crotonobetainyl-CoA:carnitine CoA-transferase CaiB-like acyl-CoA transferase